VLDEADDMIENFAGDCMFVKRAACLRRPPPQTLLFSASFECLEPSNPLATRAKSFTDQVRVWGALYVARGRGDVRVWQRSRACTLYHCTLVSRVNRHFF
jgi:hypothetical protein